MAQDDSKYTKPDLRERIKKRIMAGSKGGKPASGLLASTDVSQSLLSEKGWWLQGARAASRRSQTLGKEKWMT